MNEIILDLTTMSLQIQMGEAKTTTEMDIDVSYVNDTVGTSRTGASQQSTTNGVTLATILTAPASGHVLVVKQIFVTNKDTVVHTFKIWRVVSGGSNFEVFGETTSIAVGATWDSNASTGGGGGGTTYTGTPPISVSGSAISLAPDTATAKTTDVGADELLVGDSAASFAPKKTTLTNLWANTVGVLIAALTAKTTPVGGDMIEIADSAASNATKVVTLTQLIANAWGVLTAALSAKTTPVFADGFLVADSAASNASKFVTFQNLFANLALMPDGTIINGKISVSVASNNLTVALVAANTGSAATSTNPIFVVMNGTVYSITAALSVTKSAGTNWFNSGGAELATVETDYFAYLGHNATDGVTIGFSRINHALKYGDFNTTSTNEQYCAISTITNAAANDEYVVIGRFAATLSAGAGYTWSVPIFIPSNLVQHPIFETRWHIYNPTIVGWTTPPTTNYYAYRLVGSLVYIVISQGNAATSNSTSVTFTMPFAAANPTSSTYWYFVPGQGEDSGSVLTTSLLAIVSPNSNVLTCYKSYGAAAWTASGSKYIEATGVYTIVS